MSPCNWLTHSQVHHTFEAHNGQPVPWFKPCHQVQEKIKRSEYAHRNDSAKRFQADLRWQCDWCDWSQSLLARRWFDLLLHYNEE